MKDVYVYMCGKCRKHRKRSRKVVRIATYLFKGLSFTAKGDHMSLVVQNSSLPGSVNVKVAFKDAKGKPAKVDGVPTWTASDPTVVDKITPSDDGLSANLHIADTIGVTQITCNADVDLGTGVNNKDFVDTISVIAGEAVAADFTFDTVTPDP